AILRALEHGDGGKVGSREIVHEISAIWRKAYVVIGVFRREQRKTLATKADHIEVRLVGIFVFLPAVCQKIDAARLLIHLDNLPYRPRPLRQLAAQFAGLEVRQIKMVPAIPLGSPKHVPRFVQNAEMRFSRINVAVGLLAK